MDRTTPDPANRRVHPLVRWLVVALMKLIVRPIAFRRYGLQVTWLSPPPASDQAAIFTANHESFLDPLALGIALSRYQHMKFLAKEGFFRGRWWWFFDALDAIPINPDGGRAALASLRRMLTEVLAQRKWGAIFPDGGLARCGIPHVHAGSPGIAGMALETDAPVYLAAITGTAEVLPPDTTFRDLKRRGNIRIVIRRLDDADLRALPHNGSTRRRYTMRVMRGLAELLGRNTTELDIRTCAQQQRRPATVPADLE